MVILRQASEGGQLYGSVNTRDVAEAVSEAGFSVDRHQVRLAATIKQLGITVTPVALHPEVSVDVTVNVARSADEAEAQAAGETVTDAEAFFESEELAERAREEATEQADETAGGAVAEEPTVAEETPTQAS